jgi:hypothetical protein
MRPAPPPTSDDYPDSSDDEETFRINVPMDKITGAEDAPDSGYVLVKYKKDGEALCLDLESAMLPDEQPAMEESGSDDSLEEALKKTMESTPPDSGDEE